MHPSFTKAKIFAALALIIFPVGTDMKTWTLPLKCLKVSNARSVTV